MQTAGWLTQGGEVLARAGSGSELPARREALAALSRPVLGIHDRRKPILPTLAAKALENEPFEDLPRAAWEYRRRAAGAGDKQGALRAHLRRRGGSLPPPQFSESRFSPGERLHARQRPPWRRRPVDPPGGENYPPPALRSKPSDCGRPTTASLPCGRFSGKPGERAALPVNATSYHGLASAEWGETSWPPGPEPFLFGFLRCLPELMFFLGRWSATGLFPLIPEMMADTVAYLAAHREQIARITGAGFCWYRSEVGYGEDREETVIGPRLRPLTDYSVPRASRAPGQTELAQWRLDSHSLVRFTGRLLVQIEAGGLLPGCGESMPAALCMPLPRPLSGWSAATRPGGCSAFMPSS